MATNKEYVNFIIEQLNELEDITIKPMMGEYLIYYKKKLFGGIYDNRFLIKITKTNKDLFKNVIEEIPYSGAKPMLLVDNLDDKNYLKGLVIKTYNELPIKK